LLIGWDTFLVLDLGLDILDGVGWLNFEGDGLTGEGLDENLHTTSKSENEMKSGLLLDVVIRKGSSVLELLSGEDESLLIGWDTFLVLNLCLHVLDGVAWLDLEGDGLSGEGLNEDLHTTSESEDKMKSGLLLDVVVTKGTSIFELLSSEDKSLLIGWDTFLVLDLGLDILDGVGWLNFEGDGLTGEGLDENLHTTSKSENEMKSGLLLDVVIRKGSSVLELLSGEDESLLIGWDTFLVLNLCLHVLDGVAWLDLEGDGLSGEGLNEDLHTTSESQDEMESGLLLNVVIRKGSSVLELLSSEDESLLIGWDSFLILNLGLDVLNGVRWLDLEGDGLSSESLDEDLHTTSESQDEMESGFLLDVVVGEGSSILELLTGEDKSLLIGWDTFLVLDLGLDVLNGVGWLDFKGDGLTSEGLDEDLHTSSESQDEMKS